MGLEVVAASTKSQATPSQSHTHMPFDPATLPPDVHPTDAPPQAQMTCVRVIHLSRVWILEGSETTPWSMNRVVVINDNMLSNGVCTFVKCGV